ncbi:MAG: hypothetical protein ACE5FT_05395 [Candidatus Nanoarchaeia archaeon]
MVNIKVDMIGGFSETSQTLKGHDLESDINRFMDVIKSANLASEDPETQVEGVISIEDFDYDPCLVHPPRILISRKGLPGIELPMLDGTKIGIFLQGLKNASYEQIFDLVDNIVSISGNYRLGELRANLNTMDPETEEVLDLGERRLANTVIVDPDNITWKPFTNFTLKAYSINGETVVATYEIHPIYNFPLFDVYTKYDVDGARCCFALEEHFPDSRVRLWEPVTEQMALSREAPVIKQTRDTLSQLISSYVQDNCMEEECEETARSIAITAMERMSGAEALGVAIIVALSNKEKDMREDDALNHAAAFLEFTYGRGRPDLNIAPTGISASEYRALIDKRIEIMGQENLSQDFERILSDLYDL